MDFNESRSPFRFQFPNLPFKLFGQSKRDNLVYLSGVIFAVAWWIFVDAIIFSYFFVDNPNPPKFEDYVIGAISTFGMVIVNSLDPTVLRGDPFTYSGSSLAWKARLLMFFGITCNAGAMFGAISIACFKYYFTSSPVSYVGTSLIVQSFGILFSSIILWVAQSMDSDSHYSIVLG